MSISMQQIDSCIETTINRLSSEAGREGNGLLVRVDLRTCYLNPGQAEMFNIAIGYTRSVHGNHL